MTARAVAVAVAVPRLELDRPFTYLLPEGADGAALGTLVSVPFHGRTVRGWVLGPAEEIPARVLPVRNVLSKRPVFDGRLLELFTWMRERYVSPLSVVIERAYPPRAAGEEEKPMAPPSDAATFRAPEVLAGYDGGAKILAACRSGHGVFVLRPLPDDEGLACLEAVAACLAGGRDAVVLVPEATPLPATARLVLETVGPSALAFIGGERAARYRAWLDVLGGRYRVVVGTRPGVFAPVRSLGLIWVAREAHPAHREDRAPYYHVREVALARGGFERAVVVLAGLGPSVVAARLADEGRALPVRAPRAREREASPLVEVTRPAEEDRSPRLARALKEALGGFLLLSRTGYGTPRVCRSCGEPARCAICSGPLVVRGGGTTCAVCGSAATCTNCGGERFGIERGGTERLEEWARRVTDLPADRVEKGEDAIPPGPGRLIVGTAAAVKDFGPRRLDLVAVLDPDRALRRPGLLAPEQSLATWMEAAAWAGPRGGGGRVIVQTRNSGDPAIQALVRWDPWHLLRIERRRRSEAGFPPGFPVFRVKGSPPLSDELRSLPPVHLLVSEAEGQTVCLVTLGPDSLPGFREKVVALAETGIVTRVEAEPQL